MLKWGVGCCEHAKLCYFDIARVFSLPENLRKKMLCIGKENNVSKHHPGREVGNFEGKKNYILYQILEIYCLRKSRFNSSCCHQNTGAHQYRVKTNQNI